MSADDNSPKRGLDGTPNSSPSFTQAASGETPVPQAPTEISEGPKTPAPAYNMPGPDGDAVRKAIALEDFEKKHAKEMLDRYNQAHNQQKTKDLDRDFDNDRE